MLKEHKMLTGKAMRFMFLLASVLFSPDLAAQLVDTAHYRLRADSNQFFIEKTDGARRVAVSRDWLIPLAEAAAEEENYVSSFDYDSVVAVFPLAKNVLGVHISSYAILSGGSAMAAVGRDVFVAWDTAQNIVLDTLHLGITKDRVRYMGRPFARYTYFFIQDLDRDGRTDLAATRERIYWREVSDEEMEIQEGPIEEQTPFEWHRFNGTIWEPAPDWICRVPILSARLPMLSLSKSPVDFVREVFFSPRRR